MLGMFVSPMYGHVAINTQPMNPITAKENAEIIGGLVVFNFILLVSERPMITR